MTTALFQFQYESSWLKNDNARPISYSFPLSSQRFQRPDCVAYFSGLLPEREKRQRVARNLGIYERDDFSLLQHLGGDCAGALTFSSAHEDPPTELDDYCFLNSEEMIQTLDLLPEHPLLAGASGIRLSLAGTQPKVPAYVADNNAIGIPLETAASSHIIKLPSFKQPSSIVNEAFCLSLARLWGISVVDAHLEKINNKSYLLVKRYDRLPTPSGTMERLHQEDFCQALGICAEEKYQLVFKGVLIWCAGVQACLLPICSLSSTTCCLTFSLATIRRMERIFHCCTLLLAPALRPFMVFTRRLFIARIAKKWAWPLGENLIATKSQPLTGKNWQQKLICPIRSSKLIFFNEPMTCSKF